MPNFQKRHYEAIAEILSKRANIANESLRRAPDGLHEEIWNAMQESKILLLGFLTEDFVSLFAMDNHLFDASRFREAVYRKEEK